MKQGTVLAREMRWRRIRKHQVTAVIGCSDRQLYNYMARRSPMRPQEVAWLCDMLDMEPHELIDERGFLLSSQPRVVVSTRDREIELTARR